MKKAQVAHPWPPSGNSCTQDPKQTLPVKTAVPELRKTVSWCVKALSWEVVGYEVMENVNAYFDQLKEPNRDLKCLLRSPCSPNSPNCCYKEGIPLWHWKLPSSRSGGTDSSGTFSHLSPLSLPICHSSSLFPSHSPL